MVGNEGNSHPIQLLVNYWETPPSQMGARLDELLRRGVTHVATFIPWQAVESDISHTLARFLIAASERKVSLSLIVTPEVGVHCPFSGLPRDLATKSEHLAMDSDRKPIPVNLPPNAFGIPSAHSPGFMKRYMSFLARIDSLFADFKRVHGRPLFDVTLTLTGSYWKYYRNARLSGRDAFSALAGDFSPPASLEYRQRLEYRYSDPEFSDPTPAAANRWKTRVMEDPNQRWFAQMSEAVFRGRTLHSVKRKASGTGAREIELFTPEADPGLMYNQFLQMVSGGHGDFSRLSSYIDEAASFSSMGGGAAAASFIHWTSLGAFTSLADSEKQFLILKSLLLMGGMGGGVMIDDREWFSLSKGFRSKAEAFARSIAHGELRLRTRALYLVPHLWSPAGPLWNEISDRLGPEARKVASLDLLLRDREATLLVVDPSMILTHEVVGKLAAWARGGRVVVFPRTPLYSEMAKSELELLFAGERALELDLGIRYRLLPMGDGKLIVHEMPSASASTDPVGPWERFAGALLGLAEIQGYCRVSDSRLAFIPMSRPLARPEENLGIFVLNGTRRPIQADIVFPQQVVVSDLAVAVTATPPPGPIAQPGQAVRAPQMSDPTPRAQRFGMEVPPCGILPLSVTGLPESEGDARLQAALISQSTRESVEMAALSELPGFEGTAPASSGSDPVETVWS